MTELPGEGVFRDATEKIPGLDNNFKLCILCQENKPNWEIRKSPELSSFQTLLTYVKERHTYGDPKVYSLYNRLHNISACQLKKHDSFFHKLCYADFGGLSKKNRAKDARCFGARYIQ